MCCNRRVMNRRNLLAALPLVISVSGFPALKAQDFLKDWLDSKPGTLHSDPENPWVQDITLNTRFHWQYAWVDGRSASNDFWYENRGEIRRFYFGPTVKFLKAFSLKAEANMAKDTKPRNGERDLGYDSMFELYLTADLAKLFEIPAFDSLILGYGKREQRYTEEHMTSSRDMFTVERSMLDTYILPGVPIPSNPTGVWLEAKSGPHTFSLGMLSSAPGTVLSGWDEGRLYWGTWQRDIRKETGMDLAEVALNLIWNDTDSTDRQIVNYDWVTTAWGRLGEGPWALRGSLIYGENRSNSPGRDGYFGGIDILPTWWLVPEKVQFAMRAEYAASTEPEGLRLMARYARIAGEAANENLPLLASGRGDRHYSCYAGVNYFIHYPNIRVMAGLEWERMENSETRLTVYDGLTGWLAFRTFF
jgi:hypothetical protein